MYQLDLIFVHLKYLVYLSKILSFTLVAETLSPSLRRSSLSLPVCSLCRSFSTPSSPVPDSTCSHHSHSLTRFSPAHFTRYFERHSCLCGNTALAAISPITLPFRLHLSRRLFAQRHCCQKSFSKQTVPSTTSLYKISE